MAGSNTIAAELNFKDLNSILLKFDLTNLI